MQLNGLQNINKIKDYEERFELLNEAKLADRRKWCDVITAYKIMMKIDKFGKNKFDKSSTNICLGQEACVQNIQYCIP